MDLNFSLSSLKNRPTKIKAPRPKYYLNLAGYNKKQVNPVKFGIIVAIVAILIILFAKFLVFDRFAELQRAESEAASLKSQIDANYAKIKELDGLSDEYAHYTFSGMSEDEMALVSRVDVMEMINRLIVPHATVSSWSLQGNTLSLTVNDTTLSMANHMVANMGAEPIVNYSFVQTAATDGSQELTPGSVVTAQITAYLQVPEGTGEEVTK